MTSADTPPSPIHADQANLTGTVCIDYAVALWSGITLEELDSMYASHDIFEVKRSALISALRDGRLEWSDSGAGGVPGKESATGSSVDDLIKQGCVGIHEHSLRFWLAQIGFSELQDVPLRKSRAADWSRGSAAVDLNRDIVIAAMADLLAEAAPETYAVAGRPNAAQIGLAIDVRTKEWFGPDVQGFSSSRKTVSTALRRAQQEVPTRRWN
ncbi:hypothetical protein [Lysobacter firmicutimachus]|uniref:Uncharacterized protein n=1 Tax=Lysobacter firmicutimachus TaxID=1792846 RepID=A0ABU8CY28_9GAMM